MPYAPRKEHVVNNVPPARDTKGKIFELEDKLDAANAMMKKEKEAAKAEKEAQKKLNKKEKAPADKKKATKKK